MNEHTPIAKAGSAAKARDIDLSLIAKGWAATLADLKPKAAQPIEKSLFSSTISNKPNFGIKGPKSKATDGQRGEREVYWFETADFEKRVR